MRLKLTVEDIHTGETEDVIAGLMLAKKWETDNGRPIGDALSDDQFGVCAELARMGLVRKHGQPVSPEEFEARFEVVGFTDRREPLADPSGPAVAPPSN